MTANLVEMDAGFPFNNDALVFNVHRLYGPVRLPLVSIIRMRGACKNSDCKPARNLDPCLAGDRKLGSNGRAFKRSAYRRF